MGFMKLIPEFVSYYYSFFAELFTYDAKLIFLAAMLGSLVGLEREFAGKQPSLRTFSLICVGSALFAVVSRMSVADSHMGDPSRIAAQVVTGIGFLGAGAIFKGRGGGVSGLTTAALMWATSAIGVTVGFGHVRLALSTFLIVFFVILILKIAHGIIRRLRPDRYHEGEEFE